MPGTMTWAGLDVHARSIQGAAVIAETGELQRVRFGAEAERVVGWLASLPGPVHACYEAGPTGYGLARAAAAAGVRMDVIAPSKTPRAAGDRIKSDRKDAELLVRLLMAGQLKAVAVPPLQVEAARDLTRAREAIRVDLARWRHRVSKLLLRYGRVWPAGKAAWTLEHRAWLSRQRFAEPASELAYLDALAAMDGLLARRAALGGCALFCVPRCAG
jgi:transposase